MISCIIMGGLGNQLFQIYTTMALSMEMKTNFIFPKNKLQTDKRSHTYWDSFLKELDKNTVVIDMKNMKYNLYKEKEFKYNKIQIAYYKRARGVSILYSLHSEIQWTFSKSNVSRKRQISPE